MTPVLLATSDAALAAAATVIVAAITSTAAVVSTAISARRDVRQSAEAASKAAHALGTPNGNGSVTKMLGRLLEGQADQDVRLARTEEWQIRHDWTHRELDDRISKIGGADATTD